MNPYNNTIINPAENTNNTTKQELVRYMSQCLINIKGRICPPRNCLDLGVPSPDQANKGYWQKFIYPFSWSEIICSKAWVDKMTDTINHDSPICSV